MKQNAELEGLFESTSDIEFTFPNEDIAELEKQVIDGEYAAAIFVEDQENSLDRRNRYIRTTDI